MTWIELSPAGIVYSWTRTWYPFDRVRERAADIPFVSILAEVAGTDGARVLGMLAGDDKHLRIGVPVRGIILPPSEKTKGYPTITWKVEAP
jgi:uncharacterized OB-fold protein